MVSTALLVSSAAPSLASIRRVAHAAAPHRGLRHLLAYPLTRFLLLGALLWCAELGIGQIGLGSIGRPEIVITSAERLRLRDEWARLHGGWPSGDEERGLIDKAVEEEVLYSEALARGLDRDNPSVRARLIAIMKFLGAAGDSDDEALYRQALALNLEASEPAIRRHLVLQMRLLASLPAEHKPITDADLEDLFRRKTDLFREPARFSFTQIFFSKRQRGGEAEADARRLLSQLQARPAASDPGEENGDPFPVGRRFTRANEPALESSFGASFRATLARAPLGVWTGPIPSVFGWHLVRVDERLPAALTTFEVARPRLREMLRRERAEARYAEYFQRLRARYVVRVEDAAESSLPQAPVPAFEQLVPQQAEALE